MEKINSRSVPPFKLAGVLLIKFFNSIKLQRKYFAIYFQYFFLLGGEIFCCCFHNRFFSFSPFSFLFGNDFISMDQIIPFYGSNSSVVSFSFF